MESGCPSLHRITHRRPRGSLQDPAQVMLPIILPAPITTTIVSMPSRRRRMAMDTGMDKAGMQRESVIGKSTMMKIALNLTDHRGRVHGVTMAVMSKTGTEIEIEIGIEIAIESEEESENEVETKTETGTETGAEMVKEGVLRNAMTGNARLRRAFKFTAKHERQRAVAVRNHPVHLWVLARQIGIDSEEAEAEGGVGLPVSVAVVVRETAQVAARQLKFRITQPRRVSLTASDNSTK